jgi:hypothetical protein
MKMNMNIRMSKKIIRTVYMGRDIDTDMDTDIDIDMDIGHGPGHLSLLSQCQANFEIGFQNNFLIVSPYYCPTAPAQ